LLTHSTAIFSTRLFAEITLSNDLTEVKEDYTRYNYSTERNTK